MQISRLPGKEFLMHFIKYIAKWNLLKFEVFVLLYKFIFALLSA